MSQSQYWKIKLYFYYKIKKTQNIIFFFNNFKNLCIFISESK